MAANLKILSCFFRKPSAINGIKKTISSCSNFINQHSQIITSFSNYLPISTPIKAFHLSTMATDKTINNEETKTPPITIGTHDGMFHCDEILACFMLQQLPEYKNAKIIRSRNDEILNACDIFIDVGGVFDNSKHRFDHHQKSFEHTFSSLRPELGDKYKIRLSSAGLIYVYFGERVIKEILNSQIKLEISDECLRQVYLKVYANFISEIDGVDNGIPMFDGEPLYRINTGLSERVSFYNANWNSTEEYDAMKQFNLAKELVGSEFVDKVVYFASIWWPAREIVENALKNRFDVHESGEILELKTFCPWKAHFFEIEEEMNLVGVAKYVLFSQHKNDYRVICVPLNSSSFVCRKFLHKEWRGLRKDDLRSVCNIKEAEFVHSNGFIGGALTRDGALEMAVKSVQALEDCGK